uniref:Uncharacterized protein n=1 Tax=Cuerna arida TaxID=1464854 RepID=A0A1B6ETV4_9HEMI
MQMLEKTYGVRLVPQQPRKRKEIAKLSGESILKVFKRNSEEKSKLISNLLNQQKEQPKQLHPIDVLFQSMAMTVKNSLRLIKFMREWKFVKLSANCNLKK